MKRITKSTGLVHKIVVVFLCIGIFCIVMLVQYRWRTISLFVFARDLSEYVGVKKQLPTDLKDFCTWKTNENGRIIWRFEKTKTMIRFNSASIHEVLNGEKMFIIIRSPSLKKYEYSVNQRFVGGLPLELFNKYKDMPVYHDK